MLSLKRNDEIELRVEAVTSEGSALGHYDGIAVFVRGAVPEDVIIAHIIKVSKSYAVAVIKEIVKPSPYRVCSDCAVSLKCGGCSFREMSYEKELEFKMAIVRDNIRRIGHIDFDVEEMIGAESTAGYRNKAQYPVSIENGKMLVGFYAYKSHRIVPAAECLLQPEEFSDGIRAFEKWAVKNRITSFNEKTGKGLLRHIYFRKAFKTGEIMACAVINGNELPDADYLVSELRSTVKGLKSVVFNINRKKTNVILGDETRLVWGESRITDILLGKKFVFSPESFYQVNHEQCERLYEIAYDFADLGGTETVLDLYCGVGTIGLTLAERCKKLIGIEIVPQAVENAKINAKINGVSNAEFICADAPGGAELLKKRGIKPDVVMLDPPRKGCNSELFSIIEEMGAERIVYISCNSATLARDLQLLVEKGYFLRRLKAVDLFPRTPHVEAVALVTKNKN